jgi:hypothetical protein
MRYDHATSTAMNVLTMETRRTFMVCPPRCTSTSAVHLTSIWTEHEKAYQKFDDENSILECETRGSG